MLAYLQKHVSTCKKVPHVSIQTVKGNSNGNSCVLSDIWRELQHIHVGDEQGGPTYHCPHCASPALQLLPQSRLHASRTVRLWLERWDQVWCCSAYAMRAFLMCSDFNIIVISLYPNNIYIPRQCCMLSIEKNGNGIIMWARYIILGFFRMKTTKYETDPLCLTLFSIKSLKLKWKYGFCVEITCLADMGHCSTPIILSLQILRTSQSRKKYKYVNVECW